MTKHDEAIYMIDELDKVLKAWEKPDNEFRQPTVKGMLVLARVVRWLLEMWIKSYKDGLTSPKRIW